MPEQIAGLIEKIELDQTVGEPANDLVAAPADRGELLEIEIERQCIDAGEGLAFFRRGTGPRRGARYLRAARA